MMSSDVQQPVRASGNATFIWYFFLLSVMAMSAVTWFVIPGDTVHLNQIFEASDPLTLCLGIVALSNVILAFKFHLFMRPSSEGGQVLGEDAAGKKSAPPALALYITRLAIIESAAILGIVVALIRGNAVSLLPFALLSIAAMVLSSPTPALLRSLSGK